MPVDPVRLCSYVVVRDYGFAPNPFHGICTLATCKPHLRSARRPGDWIVGTGSKEKGLQGRMIFAMQVSRWVTFDDYWSLSEFAAKKPNLSGSSLLNYGDNIYHREDGKWVQDDSHHSYEDGAINLSNLNTDTKANKVLIGEEFYYFGRACPFIPEAFAPIAWGHRGHKCDFSQDTIRDFVAYIRSTYRPGILGRPGDW